MNNLKQRIMTIDAKKLFYHAPKKVGDESKSFTFDVANSAVYRAVVKQETMMETCPLFHQFFEVLGQEVNSETLYDKLIVVDFGDIFLPDNREQTDIKVKMKKMMLRNHVRDIMEKGLTLHFAGREVHMMPFDKSGNMSRKGRITFIDAKYMDALNERLNLGMDFGKIPVILSKYYAYRGLYLSTSARVEYPDLKLTPETLIIVKDVRETKTRNDEIKAAHGPAYETDIMIETAEQEQEGSDTWIFKKLEKEPRWYTDIPFDGEGFVTPVYSGYINQAIGKQGATSYQIRLPFAKGMVHQVDVHEFLREYSEQSEYLYEDAFGITRDLSKAHIFLTESMFKGFQWLKEYCKQNRIDDPMSYYCRMIETYNHSLYISGTNLPYGHSDYTHLSYQVINTLDFTDEQFARIVGRHMSYIAEPLKFLKGWDEAEKGDESFDEEKSYRQPNWKRAVCENEELVHDIYIKQQLEYTRRGLLTKLAEGKLVVKGQTRYLCRDLMPLLTSLAEIPVIKAFYPRCLYNYRFYMPGAKGLQYEKNYALFRSPHLSRNEQCLLKPLVPADPKIHNIPKPGKYARDLRRYDKYFGQLTGVVMIGRGSVAPLVLGGADFDGDLVSIVFDEDVVAAVESGVYKDTFYLKRKLPVIKIPKTTGTSEFVPVHVPYEHVYNTFSNRIGQLSDAAISIGQVQYGSNLGKGPEFGLEAPSCEKCTLLTGLEIDAAKNGCHPNLDLILDSQIGTHPYLQFLRDFQKLRQKNGFQYNNIAIKKDRNVIEVTAKDGSTSAKYVLQPTGTKLIHLPRLFADSVDEIKEKQKAEKPQEKRVTLFDFDEFHASEKKDAIEAFQKDCEEVLRVYFYYKRIFLKQLKTEKSKPSYGAGNLEKRIAQIFDAKHAAYMINTVVPSLLQKMQLYIDGTDAVKSAHQRMNDLQWMFQPKANRGGTLEAVIGNGFDERILTEDERELLYHFHQQGYKTLWDVIEAANVCKTAPFETIKVSQIKLREPYIAENLQSDCEELDAMMRSYYEQNLTDVDELLYRKCLQVLKDKIKLYGLGLAVPTMMKALYEIAASTAENRKFFWDAFSWAELQSVIGKKDEKQC